MNSEAHHLPNHKDLLSASLHQLIDISDIQIDITADKEQRIKKFVNDIHDPYCFRCHNIVVQVSFDHEGKAFQNLMQDYFSSLQSGK